MRHTNQTAKKNTMTDFDYEYISPDITISVGEWELDEMDIRAMNSFIRDDFIWIHILNGEIEIDVGNNLQVIHAGEAMFINSNQLCTVRSLPTGYVSYRILLAKPNTVYNPLIEKRLRRMINDKDFSSLIIHPVNPLFYADMDAIFNLSRHKPQEYEFQLLSHFLCQLRQVLRIYEHTNPEETITRNPDMESLREMLAYIGENYQNDLTLDQIAAAGKVSRSKCTRLFRTFIQKSPIHHLQAYRLERSVYLLSHTDRPVSEIALLCGFNQQSYFNRLFIRAFGITPKEMRAGHTLTHNESNS